MAADKSLERKERLARALKQNLKRRKMAVLQEGAQEADPNAESPGEEQLGPGSGIAARRHARSPSQGPKTASKRN